MKNKKFFNPPIFPMDTHFSRKKSSILFPSCAFVRFVGLVCFLFMFSVLLFSVDDGAAIIMDADSGQILLLDNPHNAVEKAFPPGSLIKVFSALYGLQQKQFEPTSVVTCKGNISLFDTNFACWNTAGHGVINLYKALAYSCNVYFYSWGQYVNGADYVSFLRSFGLGSKTGVDGYEEEAGTLLEPTNQQEVAQLFVGASTRIEVTPLQMLTAYAAIVNGGKRIVPFLKVAQNQAEPLESIDIPTYYPIIERALQEAATYGTAAPFYEETGGFGKTGTAVWAEGFRTHGWFLGYLPVPCGDRIRRIVLIVFKLEGAGAKDALPEGLKLAKEFLQRARDQQQLSVSLFSLMKPQSVLVRGRLSSLLITVGHEKEQKTCQNLEVKYKTNQQLQLVIDNKEHILVDSLVIRPVDPQGAVTLQVGNLDARDYRGELRIRCQEEALEIVNSLSLQLYLQGVIGNEIVGQLEALKAQAVVSRTYALKNIKRHGDYDFCDTTHCQFYTGGLRAEPLLLKAVEETAGEVLKYNDQLADLFYFSTCGGRTNSYHRVWDESEVPYLISIDDKELCRLSPHYQWQFSIAQPQLFQYLESVTYCKPVDLRISETGTGGWVKTLVVECVGGIKKEFRGEEFHILIGRWCGWNSLKSANFTISKEKDQWIFKGRGLGHGVGLCQWGARVLAQSGTLYPQILQHYFPGTTLTVY